MFAHLNMGEEFLHKEMYDDPRGAAISVMCPALFRISQYLADSKQGINLALEQNKLDLLPRN